MFEAYAISVRLSLVNHVSRGLLGVSGAFLRTEKDAAKLQKRLASIQSMAMKGGALLGVGVMGLGVVEKMVKPATEYAHQLQLMNTAGMKHLEIVKATQAAWSASKNMPTSTAAENLASIRELRMVFGDTHDAIQYMPTVQKMQAVLSNLLGSNAGDQAYTIAKALEMKGAVKTPQLFSTQADEITKAMVASGGKVGAQDFLSAFKYGRTATTGWNDEFTYTILPTLIQEMKSRSGSGGAGGPGNALMSMYSAVVGGTIPQKSLKVWENLGLLDPSKIVWTKTHSAKGVMPGGIVGSGMFQANPFQWTQSVLVPALAKGGYNTPEKQKEALQYLFPNRTAGFMATQMVQQPWKFHRDQKLIAQASGISSYNQLLKADPEMAALALQKQWTNLQAQLAFQVLPPLVKGAIALTHEFTKWTAWAQKHTTITRMLMWSFIGLSAAMAIGGAVLLLTAAFRGLGLALAFNKIGGFIGITKVASSLSSLATSTLALKGGAIAAAAGIGYLVGSLIYDRGLANNAGGRDIGAVENWVASHIFHSQMAKDAASRSAQDAMINNHQAFGAHDLRQESYINGKWVSKAQPVQVNTTVHLDGKQIAHVVTQHQAKAATGPQTGTSGFDGSMFPTPIGINGGY